MSPSRFAAVLARWQLTPGVGPLRDWIFVDLGSGKGRALLIASTLDFFGVRGVEPSPELAAVARSNISKWQAAELLLAPTSVVCGDAVDAVRDLPDVAVVLYLHSPLEPPAMRSLLQALVTRRRTCAAPVDLLCLVPAAYEPFADSPSFEFLWDESVEGSADEIEDGVFAPEEACLCYRLISG